MTFASLTRFWRDRRGSALIDHALVVALIGATQQVAGAHGHALSAFLGPLFA